MQDNERYWDLDLFVGGQLLLLGFLALNFILIGIDDLCLEVQEIGLGVVGDVHEAGDFVG